MKRIKKNQKGKESFALLIKKVKKLINKIIAHKYLGSEIPFFRRRIF